MTKETVGFIIENGKFKRVFQDYLNYFFLVFPLVIACIGCATLSAYVRFKNNGNLLLPAICITTFGLFGVYYVLKRLHANISFTSIPLNEDVDLDDFSEKLKTVFKKAEIYPDKNLRTVVVVTRTSAFSWGERVTIIFGKGSILVNSQPCGTQPMTILKDSLNVKRVRRLIEGI